MYRSEQHKVPIKYHRKPAGSNTYKIKHLTNNILLSFIHEEQEKALNPTKKRKRKKNTKTPT